jgi:hypothetical protein
MLIGYQAIDPDSGALIVTPVSEDTPLPITGGSTETTLVAIRDLLDSIDTRLATPASYLPPEPVVAALDATLTRVTVSITTSGDTQLVPAFAGQISRLHRFSLSISTACTLTWKSGSTTRWAKDLPTAADWDEAFSSYPWMQTGVEEALILTLSANANVKGFIDYVKSA